MDKAELEALKALWLAGSLAVGEIDASGNDAAAAQAYKDNLSRALGIQLPDLPNVDPVLQGDSEFGRLKEDPRRRQMQDQALEALMREVEFKGMTPEDAASYQQMRAQAGATEAGFRGANEARMRQRGMGGSIADYAGGMAAAQAGANSANEMGLGIAADSRRRYLQAVDSLGGMAGQVRGQEYGMGRDRASAQDAINRFNTGQRWNAEQYNIERLQKQFENSLAYTKAANAAGLGVAENEEEKAKRERQTAATVGAAPYGGGW